MFNVSYHHVLVVSNALSFSTDVSAPSDFVSSLGVYLINIIFGHAHVIRYHATSRSDAEAWVRPCASGARIPHVPCSAFRVESTNKSRVAGRYLM